MKTYRLINRSEMKALAPKVDALIQTFTHYTSSEIQFHWRQNEESPTGAHWQSWQHHETCLCQIAQIDIQQLTHHLLDTQPTHPLYEQFTLEVLQQALKAFFATDDLNRVASPLNQSWFHPGSPCLSLNLTIHGMNFLVYFNPQWILNHVPEIDKSCKQLVSAKHALSDEKLELTVHLNPFTIPLAQLSQLHPGDVIALEQTRFQPLHLTQNNRVIASTHLGRDKTHKAIQIIQEPHDARN